MDSVTCLLIEGDAARIVPYCVPIGREWWLQLFSGTVGAVIGAVVAAAAAVWVLSRTNAKQQELWDRSSDAQRIRDDQAKLEAQHAFEKQLRAQQDGIEETFRRQAVMASSERMRESVAKLSGHVLEMNTQAGRDTKLLQSARDKMQDELFRLSIELYDGHEELIPLLTRTTQDLFFDAFAIDQLFEAVKDFPETSEEMKLVFRERAAASRVSGQFLKSLSKWIALPSQRATHLTALTELQAGSSFYRIADSGLIDLEYVRRAMQVSRSQTRPA